MTPASVLRGPRRVGKTVLLRQIIESLIAEAVNPQRILYIAFDELPTLRDLGEPVLAIARWYEREVLATTFNVAAHEGRPAFLFLDEVQNLETWAPQIKSLVDNHAVRVLVTGSSSLRIEAGRDSLAGRISTLDLGPLLLREIAELRFGQSVAFWVDNGLDAVARRVLALCGGRAARSGHQGRAYAAFSNARAYPWPRSARSPWRGRGLSERDGHQRAIQHDLRMGARASAR
jgi:predicted AAA+ superfamily ATPase